MCLAHGVTKDLHTSIHTSIHTNFMTSHLDSHQNIVYFVILYFGGAAAGVYFVFLYFARPPQNTAGG